MEKGEGSNEIPDLNIAIDEMIATTYVKTEGVDDGDSDGDDDGDGGGGPSNGLVRRRRGRPKGSTKKLKGPKGILRTRFPYKGGSISQRDKENGNSEIVSSVMMRFDAVRRKLIEGEVGNEVSVSLGRFKRDQIHTNQQKRVGPVPGISIGDIFFLYGEMCLVGLHSATVAVEFLGRKESGEDDPLAISVVSSGENVDRSDDPTSLVITGFGGTEKYGLGDQKLDQKLNIPLENALRKRSAVRVIRGMVDKSRINGHIYVYDGLYTVTSMWEEKGKTGYNVFKFRLDREPDQKPGFQTWKSVEQWNYGLFPRPGIVLHDLSYGAENLKVLVVNQVDGENVPELFTYVTSLNHPVLVTHVPPIVDRCNCSLRSRPRSIPISKSKSKSKSKSRPMSCCLRNGNCMCVERNVEGLPYADGFLVTRRRTVYECGGSCVCSDDCKNKMIHTGIKFRFEVFKTVESGWGLRSWDPIRAGSFICEYAGEIMKRGDEEEEEEEEEEEGDDYVFDTTRVYKTFRWNYEPELVGEEDSEGVKEDNIVPPTLMISAKRSGNVARFMNHSCSPNVFWQAIAREHYGLWSIHVGFFAMKHIPPLQELRYDYGTSSGNAPKKICLCRSHKCRGSFG